MASPTRRRGDSSNRTRRRPGGDADAARLDDASLGDLARALARKLRTLQRRRDALAAELGRVEREIAKHAAPSARRRDGLAEILHRLLTARTLSVSEAAAAARRAGYRSRSKDFRARVNQILSSRTDLFRRVDHGRYTARPRR